MLKSFSVIAITLDDVHFVKRLKKQISATGVLRFLEKVRKVIEQTDPAIAAELDELILSQKVLR